MKTAPSLFLAGMVAMGSIGGPAARAQAVPAATWTSSTQKLAMGSAPQSVAVGDFNGDGIPDIAVGTTGSISILLGNGDGTFQAATTIAALNENQAIAVAPFVTGGPQDILTVSNSPTASNNAMVIIGNGKGGAAEPATPFSLPYGNASAVATGDFNGDGKQDFVVVLKQLGSIQSGGIAVFPGNGNGTFGSPTILPVGAAPVCVAVGNFGGHGNMDLAVANSGDTTVSVFLNDGHGNFSQGAGGTAGNDPVGIAVGDFDGDGRQDLAVANQDDGTVSIFLGQGGGFFKTPTTVSAGSGPSGIVAGDFNGDGKVDLAVIDAGGTVTILLGNGDGTFTAGTPLVAGSAPAAVAAGAFNANGASDLVVANSGSDNLTTLISQTGPPVIATQPTSQTINTGGTVVFTVGAGGTVKSSLGFAGPSAMVSSSTTYQWQFNGVDLTDGGGISGSTGPQLVIQGATAANDGSYVCIVTSGGLFTPSAAASLSVITSSNPGLATSISSRAFVGTGDNILIGGFYIVGSTSRTVLIQGLGPALAPLGVSGALQHPELSIHQSQNGGDVTLYSNTGWSTNTGAAEQQVLLNAAASAFATPVLSAGSADSELLLTLPPGGYSAEVGGADGGTGVALCAIYELP